MYESMYALLRSPSTESHLPRICKDSVALFHDTLTALRLLLMLNTYRRLA